MWQGGRFTMNHRHKTLVRIAGGALILAACSFVIESQTRAAAGKNDIGMEFVKIAPGEFTMGCSEGDTQCNADEKPAHRVQITRPFELGTYEVTQAQWQAVMNTNPSTIHGADHPVETISKTDTETFLNALNAKNDGYHYRLPTEAEWEYAARAGTIGPFAGSLKDIAWYSENSDDETHPVGMKQPNAWGLYDMEGNVREWVSDTYGSNYYSNSPAIDPSGPAGGPQNGRGGPAGPGGRGGPDGRGGARGGGPPLLEPSQAPPAFPPPPRGGPDGGRGRGGRGGPGGPRGGPGGPGGNLPVMRGGGWDNLESFLRVSARYNYYGPTLRVSDVGFRVAREPLAR
jgi:formylglycine-generating enzyme required for sulfatase activity